MLLAGQNKISPIQSMMQITNFSILQIKLHFSQAHQKQSTEAPLVAPGEAGSHPFLLQTSVDLTSEKNYHAELLVS